jgi:hypothetical protein
MARSGLRMMPTFPLPSLKFRTAGFPQYGFKAGWSDSSSGGQFKRRRVTDATEAVELTAKICRPSSTSILCILPAYLTATSGQSAALDEIFPKAPKTVRDLAHFRTLKRTMSMLEVVDRCGEPDELGGSGLNIFIYHLDDGSLVAIGAAGVASPVLYGSHTETTGKTSSLFPKK